MRNTTIKMLPLALGFALFIGPVRADTLAISDAWARATPPGARTGAAYLSITNAGPFDRLLEVRSSAAREVQIHSTVSEHGLMRMVELEALPIPAGEVAKLEPGADHLMLVELAKPLVAGESVTMILKFESAGEIEVNFPIRDARVAGP